jgi:hypothetical protein
MWPVLLLAPLIAATDPSSLPEGHPPLASPSAIAPSANELLRKLDEQPELKSKPKTLEVATSMGKLYYANNRYPDAVTVLGEASALGTPAKNLLKELKKAGAKETSCPPSSASTFEALFQQAQALSKTDKGGALACLTQALSPQWVEAQRTYAHALFLTQKPEDAVKALDGLLEAFEDPHARYSRAAILMETRGDDLKALRAAKADLEKMAASPQAERARPLLTRVDELIAAGGVTGFSKARQAKAKDAAPPAPPHPPMATGGPPALTQEMVDAVQNTERTPELEQGLAKLVEQAEEKLSKDQFQAALDDYKRVVPFQPQNGRAKAGMAWALVGLNKQPMADRVWSVAVSGDPTAVDKLGDSLKAKGNEKGAKALWAKLAQTSPDYAAKSGLQSKIR